MSDWQVNRIESDEAILEIARSARRVAVLGIKTEAQSDQAAFYVPKYLHDAGLQVIPVPVYYPSITEILGVLVQRDLRQIEGSVDILDVFRRPSDIAAHLLDIVALRPKAVWFQKGIRNDEVADALAKEGIKVVQDRCLMVEHRRAVSVI